MSEKLPDNATETVDGLVDHILETFKSMGLDSVEVELTVRKLFIPMQKQAAAMDALAAGG